MSEHDLLEIALALGTIAIGLLTKLVVSISSLNQNIAVIVARVDSHEKRLDHVDLLLTGQHGQP